MFVAAIATLLSAPVLAGCGGGHKAAAAKPAGPPHAVTFRLADATTGPVSTEVPGQPIGSTPTGVSGVTLQLYVVKRVPPGAVLVVFAVQHDAASSSGTLILNLAEGLSANGPGRVVTASGVSLLDPTGLKQYLPFMADPSTDGTCLCSSLQAADLSSAGTSYFAALVAAPPAGVSSVSFVTGVGTIAGVPLSG